MNLSVKVSHMANEYITVCNDECGAFEVVKQCIHRWMKKNNIGVTHQAQIVTSKWNTEIKHQMSTYSIPPGNVVKVDETNIDFGCEVTKTLSHKGMKTVSSVCATNSGQLKAMLGVVMDGHKFPPYVIIKVK